MSAFSYEAAKKQVEPSAEPGQQRVPRLAPDRRRRGRTGSAAASGPNWSVASADEVGQLARQVAERIDEAARELLAEGDVPEAVPGVRAGRRRAGRRNGPARSGSSR